MSKYPTLTLQPKSSVSAKPPAPASKNAVTISKGARDLMAAPSKKKLVLIHDPPFQYMKHSVGGSGGTAESAGKEAAMFEYIASFDCPVVMIVSALSGQDDAPFAVEKCIPHSVRSRCGPWLCRPTFPRFFRRRCNLDDIFYFDFFQEIHSLIYSCMKYVVIITVS